MATREAKLRAMARYNASHREEKCRKMKERYYRIKETEGGIEKLRAVGRIASRKWYWKHKKEIDGEHDNWKNEAFSLLGNKCNCCRETEKSFLQIDHVNGGGHKERKRLGYWLIVKRLIDSKNKDNAYQLLCANCNVSKKLLGECAHKQKVL